jgi:hypothetical protein
MINYNIRIKRASSSRWNSINPILSAGELGLESNTGKIKAGNGSATWSQLNYIGPNNTDLLIPTRNYYGYIGIGYWEDLTKWVVFDGDNDETIWDGVPATQLPTENDNVVVHGQIRGAKNFIKIHHLILESTIIDEIYDHTYLSGLNILCNSFVCDSTAYGNNNAFSDSYGTYILTGTTITSTNYAYFIGFGEGGNGGIINSPLTIIEANFNTGIINGNVIFTDGSNLGKINGDVELNVGAVNYNMIFGNAVFKDESNNSGTVTGNASFLNYSNNYGDVGNQEGNSSFVIGLASFFDNATNSSSITGDSLFYDNSTDNS